MANIMQMMAKAQKFKQSMQAMQARVQDMEMEGSAGNGLVTCRVNGKFELKKLKVDPSLIRVDEADVMEDLIVAAVNDARTKAERTMAEETQKVVKEVGLPPGIDLPF